MEIFPDYLPDAKRFLEELDRGIRLAKDEEPENDDGLDYDDDFDCDDWDF